MAKTETSPAEIWAALDSHARQELIAQFTDDELDALLTDWEGFWARPSQREPAGNWREWVCITGRGWGKTRTAAEWVYKRVNQGSRSGAFLGRTYPDVRDVMIEGKSGVLAIAEAHGTPWKYEPSKRRVTTHTGSWFTLYTSEEPDSIRGPEYDTVWVDEWATFKSTTGIDGLTALDNARFANRAIVPGLPPRAMITTTPKRIPSVKQIIAEAKDPAKGIHLTNGSLEDNRGNLESSYVQSIISKYAGTAMGQQEIDGVLSKTVEGAIFTETVFDRTRIRDENELPELARPIIAVDPSAGDGTGDECGITVQAVSAAPIPTEVKHGGLSVVKNLNHGYVLEDGSLSADPDGWANRVVELAEKWDVREIVAERNQGHEMIRSLLRARNPALRVKLVNARVGKEARAQPVAGLFSQGRWHLVGEYGEMEDQCLVAGTLVTTRRGDVPIESVAPGDEVLTRTGWAPVELSGRTGQTTRLIGTHAVKFSIWTTENHPIWVQSRRRFVPAKDVRLGDKLLRANTHETSPSMQSYGTGLTSRFTKNESRIFSTDAEVFCTDSSINLITETHQSSAGRRGRNTVTGIASVDVRTPVDVYNLKVVDGFLPEFYANGILVHNCTSWVPGRGDESPDRLDALVWGATHLDKKVNRSESSSRPGGAYAQSLR